MEIRALPESSKSLSGGGLLWVGKPERDAKGSVVLLHRGGATTGTIHVEDRVFSIRPWTRGVHIVEEVNTALLPVEFDDFERAHPRGSIGTTLETAPSGADLGIASRSMENDEIHEVTVLVLFTGGARKEAGGRQAIVSLIELGVAETNLALENSNANVRFKLVGTKKVAFKATADSIADLRALRTIGDGVMEKAHTQREKFGADFVHLITDTGDPEICGRAYLPDAKESDAAEWTFGLTQVRCVSPNYTFGHELGHNMGLAHDREGASAAGQFRHSYGYCDPNGAFRTMLAISSSCPVRRVLQFSSPRETISGAPTGIKGNADNARSINKIAETMSNYRVSKSDGTSDSTQESPGTADPLVPTETLAETPAAEVNESPGAAPTDLLIRKFDRTEDPR